MMRTIAIVIVALFLSGCSSDNKEQAAPKPNIIFILADDLGYGELGCYGQELIETPNLDRLAAGGIRFTQHYAGAPVCAPSRCVLLTGLHSGHAYIRSNDEWKERGDVWNYRAMIADSTLEGQRPLPSGTPTIGKLLQAAGYKTGMTGKWGLGAPQTASIPNRMGFDLFCGYNCQRQAHTYYPVHLYLNENRLHLDNDTVAPHEKLPVDADPLNPESYSRYTLNEYAPDVMFSQMISFIEANKHEPFFFYWASPIPHLPLQTPKKRVDHYVAKFGDEKPYTGDRGYFPQRYPHAAYAAMISYLDDRIGQLIRKLKEEGLYENTLIIFSSDNGPTYSGGVDAPWFHSAAPFKSEEGYTKGHVYEGGIRVPLIASWPGKIKPGTSSDLISGFQDLLPTLCEVAGAELPDTVDGISYLPELLGEADQVKHPYLYWEFPGYNGQQAVRMDQWKAVRKDIRDGNLAIELYNLDEDIRETENVADRHPDILQKMEEILKNEHTPAELDLFRMKALGD